jgi:hypothetical protein
MSRLPQPRPPKPPPPFDPVKWATLMLVVLVMVPAVSLLFITVRCAIWYADWCTHSGLGPTFRDWLSETMPVVVAVIMMRGGPRAPPPDP